MSIKHETMVYIHKNLRVAFILVRTLPNICLSISIDIHLNKSGTKFSACLFWDFNVSWHMMIICLMLLQPVYLSSLRAPAMPLPLIISANVPTRLRGLGPQGLRYATNVVLGMTPASVGGINYSHYFDLVSSKMLSMFGIICNDVYMREDTWVDKTAVSS